MTTPYHPLARGLHWLMALLIAGLLVLGHYMSELPLSPEKLQYFSWHKWAGVTVFALLWVRLAWRLVHRPPALSDTLSPLQQRLAHTGHGALYLLMLAMPLSGWLMSSAYGIPVVMFGLWQVPDLIAANPPYVAAADFESLDPVLRHEPYGALVAPDFDAVAGFEDVARIIQHAPEWLTDEGVLIVEHSEHHGFAACEWARRAGFASARTVKDVAGSDRFLVARRSEA